MLKKVLTFYMLFSIIITVKGLMKGQPKTTDGRTPDSEP